MPAKSKLWLILSDFRYNSEADEEKGAENQLIIRNEDLAKIYMDNWHKHKEHSEKHEGS
jgi:hypothetical protein